jgi:hypothetical protein
MNIFHDGNNFIIASFSPLPSAPVYKSVEENSQDDDRSSSSDGAMCSASSHLQRGTIDVISVVSYRLTPFKKHIYIYIIYSPARLY